LRIAGWLLFALGTLAIVAALLTDTTLAGGAGVGRIQNIGLLGSQMTVALLGGMAVISGCVLIGADAVRMAIPQPPSPPAPPPPKFGEINVDALVELTRHRL
jgi:hypothetical protein